jgi:hypothetical protein
MFPRRDSPEPVVQLVLFVELHLMYHGPLFVSVIEVAGKWLTIGSAFDLLG